MNRVQLTVACSVFCHLGNGVNSVTVSTLTVARKGEQEHDEIIRLLEHGCTTGEIR